MPSTSATGKNSYDYFGLDRPSPKKRISDDNPKSFLPQNRPSALYMNSVYELDEQTNLENLLTASSATQHNIELLTGFVNSGSEMHESQTYQPIRFWLGLDIIQSYNRCVLSKTSDKELNIAYNRTLKSSSATLKSCYDSAVADAKNVRKLFPSSEDSKRNEFAQRVMVVGALNTFLDLYHFQESQSALEENISKSDQVNDTRKKLKEVIAETQCLQETAARILSDPDFDLESSHEPLVQSCLNLGFTSLPENQKANTN
ncbi:MAG: hypothetical protein H7A33_00530 [Deltaproteobacteria bacterium]|nr:hypothetical protein [Deltaproteobacteria bacterium]